MEADFDRFYGRDLASLIWMKGWPASKIWSRIIGLPEDSAFIRSRLHGHTALHELLAQIRDAVVTDVHGYRREGKPKPYPRPGMEENAQTKQVNLSDPNDRAAVRRFFGRR